MLQVEGASIDKRDHAADVCGQIGETLAFDNAIGVALDYQAQHPDTLVIVTADHSHTSQMTYTTSQPATGTSFATVQTVDNTPIRVSYGTADTGTGATTSGSQHHTGAEVPVWASGPRAADIQGTIDQTDIFSVLTNTRGPARRRRHDADRAASAAAVPATLALTVGAADDVRRLHARASPATTRPRLAANVVSSAGDATLSVADPSATAPGRLANGTLRAGAAAAGQGHERRGHGRRSRRSAAPRRRCSATRGRSSNDAVDDRLQPVDRRHRAAAHGQLQQDAHADALDDEPVVHDRRDRPDRAIAAAATQTPADAEPA